MSESATRYCQHKALMRFIAQHGRDWKRLLLGLWQSSNAVQYLDLQVIFSDDELMEDYWLTSLRRTHGAKWLRSASDEDPIGYLAWLEEENRKDRERMQRRTEQRSWVQKKAKARWGVED